MKRFVTLNSFFVIVLAGMLAGGCANAQELISSAQGVRNDLPRPYSTQRDWGTLPPGIDAWAAVTAVEPAPDGQHIYVVHRCIENSCEGRSEPPVLKINYDGDLVTAFGEGLFVFPHGAAVDHEGNLWVTDAGNNGVLGHRVIKFSPDGEVLLTIGQAGTGEIGAERLFWPNDVVVDPSDGTIFVAESHRGGANNRIVQFDEQGNYVSSWGMKGSAPGQFSEPHTIAMDSRGRLFVGDRENNRIQIFTRDGALLEVWHQFGRPSGIYITADDTIYVADSESGPDTGAGELPGIMKGIRIGSARTGEVTAFIEDMEPLTNPHSGAEGVGVDHNGNVYGAVVRRRMLERHVLTD